MSEKKPAFKEINWPADLIFIIMNYEGQKVYTVIYKKISGNYQMSGYEIKLDMLRNEIT